MSTSAPDPQKQRAEKLKLCIDNLTNSINNPGSKDQHFPFAVKNLGNCIFSSEADAQKVLACVVNSPRANWLAPTNADASGKDALAKFFDGIFQKECVKTVLEESAKATAGDGMATMTGLAQLLTLLCASHAGTDRPPWHPSLVDALSTVRDTVPSAFSSLASHPALVAAVENFCKLSTADSAKKVAFDFKEKSKTINNNSDNNSGQAATHKDPLAALGTLTSSSSSSSNPPSVTGAATTTTTTTKPHSNSNSSSNTPPPPSSPAAFASSQEAFLAVSDPTDRQRLNQTKLDAHMKSIASCDVHALSSLTDQIKKCSTNVVDAKRPLEAYLSFVDFASAATRKAVLESADGNKATAAFLGWYCFTDNDKRLDSCLYHCANRECLSKLLISMVKSANNKDSRDTAADVVRKISKNAPGTFAHVLAGDDDFFNAYGGLEAGQDLYDKMKKVRDGGETKAAVPLPFRPAVVAVVNNQNAATATDHTNKNSSNASGMTKPNSNGGSKETTTTTTTTAAAPTTSISSNVGSGSSMLSKTLKFNNSSINGSTATTTTTAASSLFVFPNASKPNPAHNASNTTTTTTASTTNSNNTPKTNKNNVSTKVATGNQNGPSPTPAAAALGVPCSIANIFATSGSHNNFHYHYKSPLPLIGTRRYNDLAAILSTTPFPDRSIAPTVGLSSDVTDENDLLFQFVASKFRPTAKTLKDLDSKGASITNSKYKFPHAVTRIRMINSDELVQHFLLSHEKDRKAMLENPMIQAAAKAGSQLTDKASRQAMRALQSFYEDDDDAGHGSNDANQSGTANQHKSRIVFGWHGTSSKNVDGICRHGFFNGIRTTDSGFFGAGLYFAMEADYATRYSIAEEFKNERGEYAVILAAVSISRPYPITLERDYRSEEHENRKDLWGMSRFVLSQGLDKSAADGGNPSMAIQSPFDSHFVPVKKYPDGKHPRGEFYAVDNSGKKVLTKEFDGDVDCQACDANDPELAGHELVIARDTNAIPIAIVYFKEHV